MDSDFQKTLNKIIKDNKTCANCFRMPYIFNVGATGPTHALISESKQKKYKIIIMSLRTLKKF